jgi:hypothetical protein
MEYDQRMIIKFLLNERADVRDIADRPQTDRRQTADRPQTDRRQTADRPQTERRQTADRPQTDRRHSLVNMLINFERFNSELQKYGSVVRTSMMKFAPEDLFWMILIPKFWLY